MTGVGFTALLMHIIGWKAVSCLSSSKSAACVIAVLLLCFPPRMKIAVGPEYDIVPDFMTNAAYTDEISLWHSAITQSWSGNCAQYSMCIRMGACLFAAGNPSGTRALSSWLSMSRPLHSRDPCQHRRQWHMYRWRRIHHSRQRHPSRLQKRALVVSRVD